MKITLAFFALLLGLLFGLSHLGHTKYQQCIDNGGVHGYVDSTAPLYLNHGEPSAWCKINEETWWDKEDR